jgi:hypothetical protein
VLLLLLLPSHGMLQRTDRTIEGNELALSSRASSSVKSSHRSVRGLNSSQWA